MKTGFSFGTTSASGFSFSLSSAPPNDNKNRNTTGNDGPNEGNNDQGDVDGAEGEQEPESTAELESADHDWTLALACKVKVYHYRDNKVAKKFASGALKIQQHTSSGHRRMVLRDASGKVLLNMSISPGMSFTRTTQASKGKPPVCRIDFLGLLNPELGTERFTMICTAEDFDPLFSKLEEFAKP